MKNRFIRSCLSADE